MSEHEKTAKIIAFVGLAGSGRSAATDYLAEKGFPKVNFRGIIITALKEAGLEPTIENEKMMRDKLRREEGNDVVVNRVVEQIRSLIDAGQHRIIVDGLGGWLAYKILKHQFPGELTTVAIVAPRHLRHHRLVNRLEAPMTEHEADERDYDEIENLNKGGVVVISDYFIQNTGSLEEFHTSIDRVLQEIEF